MKSKIGEFIQTERAVFFLVFCGSLASRISFNKFPAAWQGLTSVLHNWNYTGGWDAPKSKEATKIQVRHIFRL